LVYSHTRTQATTSQTQMLTNLYGSAVPAKLSIEAQILGRFQRLPGLHSSKLGLESLTGEVRKRSLLVVRIFVSERMSTV